MTRVIGSIPSVSRAAVMYAHGAPLVVEDVPLPAELEPGAAIVRVSSTTLCGTDAHLWDGRLAGIVDVATPMIHGHEVVGRIVAMDRDAHRDALGRALSIGDRIVWSEAVCGHCHACTVLGETVMCEHRGMGFAQRADHAPYAVGGLSEYVYVRPGSARLLVPDDVEDAWAAAAACAGKTTLRAFATAGATRPGAAVVVQGAGPLGLLATAYARVAGAERVITIDASDARLAVARAWGADTTISFPDIADADDRVALVRELTRGLGADLVLDLAGGPTSAYEGILMTARKGAYVAVGIAGPGARPIPMHTVMRGELRVLGSMNGDIADLARAIEFLRTNRHRFDWNLMFDPPIGLADATDALMAMNRAETIKPVVTPNT